MTGLLLVAFVFLGASVIAVPLATRLGLGSVIGYFIAGLLIAPILSALKVDVVSVQHFAEFGVVMMLFLVGLELEPRILWSLRRRLFGLGGGQVALTAGSVTAVMLIAGYSWQMALAVGLILSLSSTAIVLQSMQEKGLIKTEGGQGSFSILLFQDIAVIPMLALFPLLASPDLVTPDIAASITDSAVYSADHSADAGHDATLVDNLNAWQTALLTIGAVAMIVLGGPRLTHLLLRTIIAANLRELFTAAALLLMIGITLLMTSVGLSPALGTFLAGVVLANSEYKHELEANLEPFKGLLLGVFFITVGAGIDLDLLFARPVHIIGLTLALMTVKAAIVYALAGGFKIRDNHQWLMGLATAQAGEFGFVLVALADAQNVLPADITAPVLLIIALSMLLTPCLFLVYDKVIAPRFTGEDQREDDTIDETSKIIIAGRGRMGGIVDRVLRAAGHAPTVIDYNSRHLETLKVFGVNHTYFGDATRSDLLWAAGIEDARMIVIAIDGKDQITRLVGHVLATYPHVHVVARAIDRDHVFELWRMGCRDIIRETYDSALRMSRSALEALGADRDTAGEAVEIFNEHARESMIEVASSYRADIPVHENRDYVNRVRQVMKDRRSKLEDALRAKLGDDTEPRNDGGDNKRKAD